ncbi:MAG: hypothetical protein M3512_12290 [Bacteroidota bacterium]|nr:hypothetical protein [Bacteroidota bacterium]
MHSLPNWWLNEGKQERKNQHKPSLSLKIKLLWETKGANCKSKCWERGDARKPGGFGWCGSEWWPGGLQRKGNGRCGNLNPP